MNFGFLGGTRRSWNRVIACQRDDDVDLRPAAVRAVDAKLPAQGGYSPVHVFESMARCRGGISRQAAAIVGYNQAEAISVVFNAQTDFSSVRVADDVVQGFLGYEKDRVAHA